MEPLSFEGIKFWISKHVPPLVKLDVRKRKGEIVVLEREADICLVDHNEYVADPDRFYSYLWVKECLSKNARVDESRFLVAEMRKSMPTAPQTVASSASREPAPSSYAAHHMSQAPKRSRTVFTNEDDRILIDWLKKHAEFVGGTRNGLNGNEVYKDLAREYPHHTFHSWRDRWVKKLSKIVAYDYIVRGDADERGQQPLQAPVERTLRRTVPAPVASPKPRRPHAHDHRGALRHDERVPFLNNIDMAILRGTWKESRSGETKTQAAFFMSLAAQYPKVSTEQWEARYKRLRAWYDKIDVFDLEEDRPSGRPSTAVLPAVAASHSPDANNGNDKDGDKSGDDDGHDDDHADDDDVDFDASALLDEVSAQDGAQKQFLGFVDFFNANGGGYYIPRAFVIGGRLLEIWTLWTAVQDVGPDPKMRDWGEVARALSFDTAKHPAVQHELETWYAHNMADFEEARAEFEADEEADEPAAVIPGTQAELSAGAKRRLMEAFGGDEDEDEDGDGNPAGNRTRSLNRKRATRASEVEPPSDDEDNSAFGRRLSAPPTTIAGWKKAAEPETQDFVYGQATQARNQDAVEEDQGEDEDEDGAIRSSQQLQADAGTIEAVPLSLPGRQPVDSTSGAAAGESPLASKSTWSPQASSRRSLPGWLTRSQLPMA